MTTEDTQTKEGAIKAAWAKLVSDKAFWNLWGKIASGAGVLAILGYMLSWGFVTINSLEEKVAKLERKERDDGAQWSQILRLSQETRENEIEIKVLQKLYDIRQLDETEKTPDKLGKDDETVRKLSKKLEKLEKESKQSPEQFRHEAMRQQMLQKTLPQAK